MKRALEMDGGDGCTLWMHLIPLNCTLKNGKGGGGDEGRSYSNLSEGQAGPSVHLWHLHSLPSCFPLHTQVIHLRKKHTSIHFFNKSLSIFYIPWIALRAGNTAENMADKVPNFMNCIFQQRRHNKHKISQIIIQFQVATSVMKKN